MHKGVPRLFVQNFLSHSTEKFRWGTLRCFRKFPVSQNFMHKKGTLLNSVEKFLSHSADKIRRRNLLCFERILVSKFFKQRRGEASRFCQIFFISQDRKNFAREPFCVLENFWREKYFMDKRGGGGITIFGQNFFVWLYQNISLIGEHFGVSEKLSYRKFSCIGGVGITALSKIFCLTGPKRKSL